MGKVTFAVFLLMIFAGTLGLAPATRTLTDIKGPVFAAGTMLVALGVFLGVCRLRLRAPRQTVAFGLVAAAYLLFTALSAFWASHPWSVKYALAERFLALVLAFSAGILLAGDHNRRLIAVAYAILGALVSVFSLVWHGVYAHTLNDVRAPLGNANLLGAFLVLAMAMTFALVLHEWRGKHRKTVLVGAAVALALNMVVFILCRSLSAWIALAVFAGVFALLTAQKRVRMLLVAVVLCAALLSAFWFAGGIELFSQTRTYLERAEYWRRAAAMARERPLLGWGAGNYFTDNKPLAAKTLAKSVALREGGALRQITLYEVLGRYHPSSPHNEYLQHAAEGGVVGLALYGAVLLVPLWFALRRYRSGFGDRPVLSSAIGAYCAFLATNSVTMNMRFADFAPHFWILAGLLLSAPTAGAGRAEAVVKPPKVFPWLLTALATALAACGIYTFAIRDYRSSILYKSGENAYTRRQFPAAARAFEKASQLTWDANLHTWSQRMLARTYLLSGPAYLSSACVVFEALDGKVAGYVEGEFAGALERAGFYERALEYYRRHLELHPRDENVAKRVSFLSAIVDLRGGRREGGAAAAGEYFRANPDDVASRRIYLTELLELEGPELGELRAAAAALEGQHRNGLDMFLIGRVRLLEGDAAAAIEIIEDAKRSGYSGPGSNYYRGLAYLALGRLDDARRVVGEGLKVHPNCKPLIELEQRLDELIRNRATAPLEKPSDAPRP